MKLVRKSEHEIVYNNNNKLREYLFLALMFVVYIAIAVLGPYQYPLDGLMLYGYYGYLVLGICTLLRLAFG